LLSSEDESEHGCSGGGPPSESEPPRVLPIHRARVGTAGAAEARVRRAEVAAGVRSVAAEAKVRALEAACPRIGSNGGGVPPSSSDKDESLACVSHGAWWRR
jgi:hypothetical protein